MKFDFSLFIFRLFTVLTLWLLYYQLGYYLISFFYVLTMCVCLRIHFCLSVCYYTAIMFAAFSHARYTGWSNEAGPVHISLCIFSNASTKSDYFSTLKQLFMSNNVLNDICSYSLENANKMKQLAPVFTSSFIQPL